MVYLKLAKSKVDEILANSSSPKSRVDVENDVFNNLMYEEEIPKRPVGFGFGVNSSSVFGVHGELRKSGYNCANNSHLEVALGNLAKQNHELQKKNEALESKFDQNQQFLMSILNEMRNCSGCVSCEVLDAAHLSLHRCNSQVQDKSGGDARRESEPSGDARRKLEPNPSSPKA